MGEQTVPETNESTLSYRGQCLLSKSAHACIAKEHFRKIYLYCRQVLRFLLDIHPSKPHSNCSRGDNDHSVPILAKLDGGFNNQGDNGEKWFASLLINN